MMNWYEIFPCPAALIAFLYLLIFKLKKMLNQKNLLTKILFSLIIAASFTGCSKTDSEGPASTLPPQQGKGIQGLYILCEGSFGASNASLDYYDFEGDTLYREVFKKANPQIVKGLGDIGNDVAIYGTKMYLVIN